MTTYYKVNRYKDFRDGSVLVEGELLTKKEKDRYNYPDHWFTVITAEEDQTYWFFGARFI